MRRHIVEAVLLFNTITAIGGGIALATGLISPDFKLALFNNYLLPGVILALIVGGSSLYGYLAMLKHHHYAALDAMISSLILLIWVVVEIALIQQTSALQFLYISLAAVVITLGYTEGKREIIGGNQTWQLK
jgi:hypothetical protein